MSGCSTKIADEQIWQKPNQKSYSKVGVECGHQEIEIVVQKRLEEFLNKHDLVGNGIIIKCKANAYDPGNRALRYFVGFGAGAAKLQMQVQFLDAITQEKISSYVVESKMAMGVFGGDALSIGKDATDEIINKLKPYLSYKF